MAAPPPACTDPHAAPGRHLVSSAVPAFAVAAVYGAVMALSYPYRSVSRSIATRTALLLIALVGPAQLMPRLSWLAISTMQWAIVTGWCSMRPEPGCTPWATEAHSMGVTSAPVETWFRQRR